MLLAVDGEDPVAVLILEAEGDGQRLVVDAAVAIGEEALGEKHLGARGSDATCFSDLCNLDTVYSQRPMPLRHPVPRHILGQDLVVVVVPVNVMRNPGRSMKQT